jgi:hypothetical protein
MSTYNLKDKITTTKEFLNELETKSWQEIEHLQTQIANIEDTRENAPVIQLLKNLLTSYYVFIGGIENITIDNTTTIKQTTDTGSKEVDLTKLTKGTLNDVISVEVPNNSIEPIAEEPQDFEPFEYFVDFDEPSGEPISDKELYG